MQIAILIAILISVALLFVAAAVVAAMDAQGALVFLFALPLCAILLWVGHRLSRGRRGMRILILAEGVFLVAFVVSAFVSPLQFIAAAATDAAARGFTAVTGMSPYAWARQQDPRVAGLKERLATAEGEISVAQISAFDTWNRLCIFGPSATEDDAAEALGYRAATLAQSRVPNDESVAALVFVNERGTLGVVDVDRALIDFAELSRRCLTPADFPLRIDASTGRKVAKISVP